MANSLHMSTRTITIRIFHDNFREQKNCPACWYLCLW